MREGGRSREMKGCELCTRTAWMYCESDDARLCWECDARVHGANFLVARHERCLLCRACQSPTPWRASGHRLTPTASLCHGCCSRRKQGNSGEKEEEDLGEGEGEGGDEKMGEDEVDEDEEEEAEEEEEEEEEEEGDYQVVPWTSTPPPPPVASSSSSEESSTPICSGFLKRMREDSHLLSQKEHACSSSQPIPSSWTTASEDEVTSFGSGGFFTSASTQSGTDGSAKRHQHDILDISNRRNITNVHLASSSSRSPPT